MTCDWDIAKFLIFSDNGIPLIYYSHFTAIAIFIGLLGFTFLRLKQWPKRSFRLLAASYGIWLFCDIVLWANEKIPHVLFFWTVINIVEPLIFVFAFSFFLEFVEKKTISLRGKWIIFALLLPTLIMAPLGLSVVGFDYTTCDRNVVEGIAAYYNYFLEALFLLLIIAKTIQLVVRYSRERLSGKTKLVLIAISTSFLLFSFLLANFLGTFTGDYETSQLGHIAVPIFAAFLAYITVRYESFKPRILFIDTLVGALFILLLSLLFVDNRNYQIYANLISFVIMIPLGYSLMTGIRKEVKQREQLEKISTELRAANEQLKKLDQQKNEFLSFASHDLKSPIALIKQFASLIYDGTYKDPNKVSETILKIKNTADRAVNMVNTFLDLRRIEEGRMEYNFEQKNIIDFVKGITEDFTPLAKQQKNIAVSFSATSPDIQARFDTNTLRQVLQNYLDNALKYTGNADERGLGRGQTPTNTQNWIKVNVRAEDKTVLIAISDSGLGMDKELLSVLFEQFRRDPSVAKKIQGTGLGLFIAKQIVRAHHGDTWAESDGKGKGSTFYIRLPKA